jgi:Ser/Thr protein kinase RdoA (MazF antagonist)
MIDQNNLARIFSCFATGADFLKAEPLAGGLINTNLRIRTQAGGEFLLQRVNRRVFARPELVMENILRVTKHLREAAEPTLEYLPLAEDGSACLHTDDQGEAWRLCRFVQGTVTRTVPRDASDAQAAGRAFGRFLARLADFPAEQLHETLPGFHDTSARWAALLQAHLDDPADRAFEVADEMNTLFERGDLAQGLARLELPVRVVHNDAKLANVLLDDETGQPACVVDLDTVMPGTALHDFGDMMRTICCTADEEEIDLDKVNVDPALLEGLATGWLAEADAVLTPAERFNLLPAGLIITFEQAVRFLTDHLQGDVYYHTARPDHNLDRCRNQLRLLESMIQAREDLAAVLP